MSIIEDVKYCAKEMSECRNQRKCPCIDAHLAFRNPQSFWPKVGGFKGGGPVIPNIPISEGRYFAMTDIECSAQDP